MSFAIDTSALVDFFHGVSSSLTSLVENSLESQTGFLPHVVLSEMLSDHRLSKEVAGLLRQLPLLPIKDGYWGRVGLLRAAVLKRGYKAKLADALVAQFCIDNQLILLTKDKDFRHFVRVSGLQVAA